VRTGANWADRIQETGDWSDFTLITGQLSAVSCQSLSNAPCVTKRRGTLPKNCNLLQCAAMRTTAHVIARAMFATESDDCTACEACGLPNR
jgi:hypothetical protein